MSKRRNTRRTRADTTQASTVTMDAFSNPAARIGFGTMDLLQADRISPDPYDPELPAPNQSVPG